MMAWLALGGCAMQDARIVEDARSHMIGLQRADLYVCAGFPSKTARIDVMREMLSYESRGGEAGGLNLSIPVVGGINLTGDPGYCHATFELIDGVVTRVGFGGDNDVPGAPSARCAPIVKDCLRMPHQPGIGPLRAG
ncbi:hypothetical protein [Teichococcus oryzae]|uniref:Uncharacterized protein n=1 Tax=Teichococcus oryzae TaxID=1608942 RepID=A0A5B2TCY6_9PROT|nr:hypothetical protein [Pseudoroseomonas oryzae]KAA2211708.1 hypothetical protein F0Q34_18715 [Pseudoroseomonas oryzae]